MAILSYRINITSTGDVSVIPNTVISKRYVGFRCLHIAEGGYQSDPNGMPEVRPSFNAPSIGFTRSMQLLTWSLMSRNPNIQKRHFPVVFADTTALTNGNGYFNEDDPRADWVNLTDTDSPNPRLMKAIIFGGMFIRGEVVGSNLICRPGVHGIDATKPLPTVSEVLERNWYFAAVTCKFPNVSHFPQGLGAPVLIPYFLTEPVAYPLSWFSRWDESFLPDPLAYY